MTKRATRGPIAITGVSGYVGQHFLRHGGNDPGRAVIGVDINAPLYAPPHMKFYSIDIRQGYLREVFKRERVETVVHLAFVLRPHFDIKLMHEFNVEGSRNVLAAAAEAGAKKVLLMSSTAVYGANPDNPPAMTEDTPLRGHPGFPYVRDQIAVERLAVEFGATHQDVEVVVLRPCIIYGRRTRSFLLDFFRRMPILPMPGGANPPLQFIHVDDAVRALQLALEKGRGAYNVIGRGTIPYAEVAHVLRKRTMYVPRALAYSTLDLLGMAKLVEGLPPYTLDFVTYPWVADGGKAERELGFHAKFSSREALESMLNN